MADSTQRVADRAQIGKVSGGKFDFVSESSGGPVRIADEGPDHHTTALQGPDRANADVPGRTRDQYPYHRSSSPTSTFGRLQSRIDSDQGRPSFAATSRRILYGRAAEMSRNCHKTNWAQRIFSNSHPSDLSRQARLG